MTSNFLRTTGFIFLTLVSFNLAAATLLDRIVAVVNDDIILASELDEQVMLATEELRQRQINLPDSDALRERVLDSMIMQSLQEERAKMRGLSVSDDEINAQLLQLADANNLTLLQLREVLNREMPDGFNMMRQQISEQILIQKLREVEVISQIHVTEDEINNFIQRRQLQTSHDEYHLAHILITRPDSPTAEQRRALEQRVNDIYQQLQAGADFAQMAVQHSEGSTALSGGDIGWLQAGEIPTFFIDIVEGLAPGEFSNVIDTPSGFHFVKLLDKRSNQQQSELLEQEALQSIRMRKANETFDLWMRRLRDEAFIELRLEPQA